MSALEAAVSKTYGIVEMFATVQGEGVRAGARSVFCRMAGCNAWNGREEGREKGRGACSAWCDTVFATANEKRTADEIVEAVRALWPLRGSADERWVVLTGGEPFLQVDAELLITLRAANINVAVETNGSVVLSEEDLRAVGKYVTLLTVSPKRGMQVDPRLVHAVLTAELKVVLPGGRLEDGTDGWSDDELTAFGSMRAWQGMFVQPQDPHVAKFIGATLLTDSGAPSAMTAARQAWRRRVERCLSFVESHRGVGWRISTQTHKTLSLR